MAEQYADLGRVARYEQIRREMTERIRSGEYAPGELLPSEKELTEQYAVSRITASKALSLLKGDGFVTRVQGKGTYVAPPDSWGRAQPMQEIYSDGKEPKKIGLIIPKIVDLHGMDILNGVMDALRHPDYFVFTLVSQDQDGEDYSLKWLRQQRFDGLIVFPADAELYNESLLSMQLERYPFVLIDRFFPGVNCSYVTADNRRGGELAAEYLMGLGHERIAFCASSPMTEQATALRFEGYSEALRKGGILPRDCVRLGKSSEQRVAFVEALRAGEFTAAVASNAFTGVMVRQACQECGLRVPEDFSIVSFDNMSLEPGEGSFYTYIDQQSNRMGKQAGAILAELLGSHGEERGAQAPVQLLLEPKLVRGKSTGVYLG